MKIKNKFSIVLIEQQLNSYNSTIKTAHWPPRKTKLTTATIAYEKGALIMQGHTGYLILDAGSM